VLKLSNINLLLNKQISANGIAQGKCKNRSSSEGPLTQAE